MIENQNTITLMAMNGYHEEYTLDPAETGTVLPGYIVSVKDEGVVGSQAALLAAAEPLIVKENALFGGTINRPSTPGEVLLLQRGVPGDRYLLRAEAGTYNAGDALYKKQYAGGVGVSKTAAGNVFAIADETFTIDAAMVDLKDESTPDGRGVNQVPNGGCVNLLKCRLA